MRPSLRYALLLAFVTACSTAAHSPAITRLDGSTITVDNASMLARKTLAANRVTGAQIAVLNAGRLVWSEAFGLRGVNPDLPMQRSTTTWAASITKGLFATYVMTLVERGEFDLDRPVAQQLDNALNAYEPYKDIA